MITEAFHPTSLRGGIQMVLHDNELISDVIRNSGLDEACPEEVRKWLEANAPASGRPASTFLDIGGNIGACALPAASRGFVVITVEPSSPNYLRLAASALLSTFPASATVFVIPAGAGASTEIARVMINRGNKGQNGVVPHDVSQDELNEIASRMRADRSGEINKIANTEECCVVRIDDIVEGIRTQFILPPPRYMKIDIEGFEEKALSGAEATLTSLERVTLELSPGKLLGNSQRPENIRKLLIAAGFRTLAGSTCRTRAGFACPTQGDLDSQEAWER